MSALVQTAVETVDDFTVIATSPSQMETAQRSLVLWSARKIQMAKNEIENARGEYDICRRNGWKTDGWRSQILKMERKAEFYRKIKAALEAGYYIVPPFPVDVFAIRTKKALPNRMDGNHRDNHDQQAQALAIGEGRYVDPKPIREKYQDSEKQRDGSLKAVTKYYASEFQDCDFPFKLAKAEVREATDRAMSLKIFDRLGVLPRVRKPDPVVCGQIIIPNKKFYRWSEPECVTFFVAWWLDTATL